jgi:hypothetical protein
MTGFSDAESNEDFKLRLNSLTEKLNRIHRNLIQAPNRTEAAVV